MSDRVTPPPGFHLLDAEGGRGVASPLQVLAQRLLRRPAIIHRGAGRRDEIALTFDDGPSEWTAAIASALEEHGCHATFFLRGLAVVERPESVVALAKAGHELGNHLWTHTDPTTQEPAELRTEIKRTAEAIQEATGAPAPKLVRPPYCKSPQKVALAARRCGVRAIVLRSVGSSDWAAGSSEEIFRPVLGSAEAGGIVCMHDGVSPDERDSQSRAPTVEAVAKLVPALLERGLRPVTISRLLRRGKR